MQHTGTTCPACAACLGKKGVDDGALRSSSNQTSKPVQVMRLCAQPCAAMKLMRSARSLSFLMPAKTIFVPGMYFFGFTKYSNMCLSDQTIPEFLFASEYAKPS